MTIDQATEWVATLTEEQKVKLIHEHWQMKQILCAQTLLIPTGTDNWFKRAVIRAQHLTECRRLLRDNLRSLATIVEETTMEEFRVHPECDNCTGTGRGSDGNSCVICRGSGKRVLSL